MSVYEPLPDSTIEEEGRCRIISPYTTEFEDIKTTHDEMVVGVSRIEGIEASPVKSKEKYSGEEKKHRHLHPGHSSKIKYTELEKVAARKPREDSIEGQLYHACLRGDLTVIKKILDKHFVTLMPDEYGQTPLFAACIGHHREVVEYLIHYGYDVNHQDNEGKTALHITFEHEQPDIARILINQFNASFKIRDARGWTALHSAVDRGYFSVASRLMQECLEQDTCTDVSWLQLQAACHERKLERVQFLLDTKADLNHVSSGGFTALYLACRENSVSIMQCLIEHGADPNVICSKDKKQKTACHKAVLSNNYQAVECLLKSPIIDLNIPDSDGDTPLHLAVMKSTSDIVSLLLSHDMDLNRLNYHRCQAPLHIAVAKRRTDVIHALLKKNANPNLQDSEGHTPLHVAVIQRDRTVVNILCQYRPEADIKTENGITPLHIAAHKSEEAIMKDLLELGADPNLKDPDGDTCLLMAIHFRKESIITMLLEAGADVNHTDNDGDSCLHVAVYKGIGKETIQTMIEHGAVVNAVNRKDQTPLLVALAKRQLGSISVLVNAGANPDMEDRDGNTCLHIAIHKGFTDAVPILVPKSSNINRKNDYQETPLFLACAKKNLEQVKMLLEAGANPDICCKEEITCLQVACSVRHHDLVRLLLPHCKELNKPNLRKHTALILACSFGDVDTVRCLLEAGANPNITDRSGDNCLHMAVMKHLPKIAEVILEHNIIDINAKNQQGHTALFIACAKSRSSMAKLLMDHHADLDIPDDKHNSPLHMAVVQNALNIARELLAHGADINFKGQLALTPLHFAVSQGTVEAVTMLLDHHANTDCQDSDNDTPLHLACRSTTSGKAALLLDAGANTEIKNSSNRIPLYYAVKNSTTAILEAFEQRGLLNSLVDSCETALHYYCRRGNTNMVKWLIEHGADKDKVCVRGSPLDAALDSDHEDIVHLLIDAGAEVSKSPISRVGFLERVYRQRLTHFTIFKYMVECKRCEVDLTKVNEDGETLFFQACKDEAIEVIQLLLDCPRDIGINKCNKFGKSPVSIVCERAVEQDYDAVHILRLLLDSKRAVDVNIADYQSMTPLHIASQNGHLFMVNMLLRKSTASVNSCNAMDRTPLHFAGTADIVELLMKSQFRAKPDMRDYLGQTPLLFNCQQGKQDVASAMLEIQPNAIQTRDQMGRTVMHHCTAARILKMLKDVRNLPINAVDINEQSALHLAVMNDDQQSVEIVEELLNLGADPNVMDKCKLTPLHLAKSKPLYDLLKKHGANTAATSVHGNTPEDMYEWHQQLEKAKTTDLHATLSRERHDYLQKIIDMPLVGFIENHQAQRKEYAKIKELIKAFIKRLAVEVQKEDSDLEIELMPSGSMNEGTKVCMPDEGDFIFLLTKFSKMIQEPKKFSYQTANVTLNLREEYMHKKPDFVDEEGRVMTQRLFQRFYTAVQKALTVSDIWTTFHQLYRFEADDITKLNAKISHLELMYHGEVFKWMPISVDVVPGIVFPGWQPTWCQDRAVLEDTQCCVVAKTIDHAPEDMQPYLFQLGFTDADAAMFNRIMSPQFREGYKLAKIMRQPTICRRLTNTKGEEFPPASSYISSYMLKTITFHLHEEYLKWPEKFQPEKGVLPEVQIAHKIYSKLADALRQDFLEMYPIAGHDLLRNHYKNRDGKWTDYKIAKRYCESIRQLLNGSGKDPADV